MAWSNLRLGSRQRLPSGGLGSLERPPIVKTAPHTNRPRRVFSRGKKNRSGVKRGGENEISKFCDTAVRASRRFQLVRSIQGSGALQIAKIRPNGPKRCPPPSRSPSPLLAPKQANRTFVRFRDGVGFGSFFFEWEALNSAPQRKRAAPFPSGEASRFRIRSQVTTESTVQRVYSEELRGRVIRRRREPDFLDFSG